MTERGDGDALDEARREALESIRQEGAKVAIDTRMEIQEKTRQWVTASAAFLILALGLLTFFGYREVADFRRELANLETDAEERVDKALENSQEQADALEERLSALQTQVDRQAQQATERIRKARADLDSVHAEFEQKLDELDAASQRLADSQEILERARALEASYRDAQGEVRRQLEQIGKLQNSFFNVFVMYDGPEERVREVVDPLLADIRAAGFVVRPENIMRLKVDRTEVLYYDQSRPPQVDQVLEVLRQTPVGERLASRGEPPRAAFKGPRNPRDLLIKVRLY